MGDAFCTRSTLSTPVLWAMELSGSGFRLLKADEDKECCRSLHTVYCMSSPPHGVGAEVHLHTHTLRRYTSAPRLCGGPPPHPNLAEVHLHTHTPCGGAPPHPSHVQVYMMVQRGGWFPATFPFKQLALDPLKKNYLVKMSFGTAAGCASCYSLDRLTHCYQLVTPSFASVCMIDDSRKHHSRLQLSLVAFSCGFSRFLRSYKTRSFHFGSCSTCKALWLGGNPAHLWLPVASRWQQPLP